MPRGGKREGAGRPSTGKPTTKATIYTEDRELINSLAKELNITVNELIHRAFNNKKIKEMIKNLL